MPFVHAYDESEIETPDNDSEPYPRPRADEFFYLSPPDFGGAQEPVRYSFASLDTPPSPESNRKGRGAGHVLTQWSTHVALALRAFGVRRAYCRYDGGSDEGFAWLEHVETEDGRRIDAAPLIETLAERRFIDTGTIERLKEFLGEFLLRRSPEQVVEDLLVECAEEWATMLLGRGFGTGEYSMYGAFAVDLETCAITDDPSAEPVVEHIEIDRCSD